MAELLQGTVMEVHTNPKGSLIAVDTAINATVLPVESTTDFSEDGGDILVLDTVLSYINVLAEESSLTLSAPLPFAVVAEDAVLVHPLAEEKRALVQLSEDEEAQPCRIPHDLQDRFTDGIRDEAERESVYVEFDGSDYILYDAVDKVPNIDGTYIDPETLPAPPEPGPTEPPASSPTFEVQVLFRSLVVKTAAIDMYTTLTYEVSTDSSFTSIILSVATRQTFVQLSPVPAGTDLWIRVTASNDLGSATPSAASGPHQTRMIDPSDVTDAILVANEVYSQTGYFGDIIADQILGGRVTTPLLLAAAIRTAESGSRIEVKEDGIFAYDHNDELVVSIPAAVDEDNPPWFKGNITAGGLLVEGGAEFRGASQVSPGAEIVLDQGVVAPTTQPSLATGIYQTVTPSGIPAGLTSTPHDIRWNSTTSRWEVLVGTNGSASVTYQIYQLTADGVYDGILFTSSAITVPADYIGVLMRFVSGTANGIWLKFERTSGTTFTFYIRSVNASGAWTTDITVAPVAGADPVTIDEDASGNLVVWFDNYDNGDAEGSVRARSTGNHQSWVVLPFTPAEWGAPHRVLNGSFDLGSTHWVVLSRDGDLWVYNSSKVRDTNRSWPMRTTNSWAIAWDGTHFWDLVPDSWSSFTMAKYEGGTHFWTSGSAKWWSAFAWYDDVGTLHETNLGPIASITMKKRSKLRVSGVSVPIGAGDDDIKAARVYVGKGATQPALSDMWAQTPLLKTNTSETFSAAVFSGSNGTQKQAAFPDANNPGLIRNPDSTLLIKADGSILAKTLKASVKAPYARIGRNTDSGTATNSLSLQLIGMIHVFEENRTGMASTAQNGIIIPEDGLYYVSGSLTYASSGAGVRRVTVGIPGTGIMVASAEITGANAGADGQTVSCSNVWRLTQGTLLSLYQGQNSGADLALLGAGGGKHIFIDALKVSD